MADYNYQAGLFGDKDSLATGQPLKEIVGSEFETQFSEISEAILSKLNAAAPNFTGTMTGPAITLSGTLQANLISGGTF